MNNGLRIAGIKEPITWITNDKDEPIAWSAGVEIVGLMPHPSKGYRYKYTRELISNTGEIVNTGILSQAPGYLGTHTTVAIGGRLTHGEYTVRVWSDNGDEDKLLIWVPDYQSWIRKKQEENCAQSTKDAGSIHKSTQNNNLKNVNEVFVDESNGRIKLSVRRKDDTVYSVVLSDPNEVEYIDRVVIGINTIETIKKGVSIWDKTIGRFADDYIKEDRKEIEFFNDIVLLCSAISKLPNKYQDLLKFGTASDLLHNRIIAQLIGEYDDHRLDLSLTPRKTNDRKIHDFNIGFIKCEVKTIQSIGELERLPMGGTRLTEKSHNSLVSGIRKHMDDAFKVGRKGMIFVHPWSYKINGLLRQYFVDKLSLCPPIPSYNTTTLILSSDNIYRDYYVTFQTHRFLPIFEYALSSIQLYGVTPMQMYFQREGVVIEASTAPRAGSVAGYSFKLT